MTPSIGSGGFLRAAGSQHVFDLEFQVVKPTQIFIACAREVINRSPEPQCAACPCQRGDRMRRHEFITPFEGVVVRVAQRNNDVPR